MTASVAGPSDHAEHLSWPSVSPLPLPQNFPALPQALFHFYLEMPDLSTWQMVQEEPVIFPISCSSSLSPILMSSLPTLPPHLPEPEN